MSNNTLTTAVSAPFSAEEKALVMARLYQLLSGQVGRYLGGDSTSLPVETAEELLRSLLYTLRLALSQAQRTERDLLTCDLEQLLHQGQLLLQEKQPRIKALWQSACLSAPPLRNVYLQDTLRGMGAFFKHYDSWYFAHQIPCAIDYPLCVPVPETLQGISYLEEWLQRLLLENWFLGAFPIQSVHRLLTGHNPDYADCPLNLCELPLLNAVALTLLEKTPVPLVLSDSDLAELTDRLRSKDRPDKPEQLGNVVRQALARLLARLQAPEQAAAYFTLLVEGTLPRLQLALSADTLGGIFAAASAASSLL